MRWNCRGGNGFWTERSVAAKVGIVAAGVVLVPSMLALIGAVTMWLWNALLPGIFGLPRIGFFQAVGILILSQILFKGGSARHMGRSHMRKARLRDSLREERPDGRPEQGP
jgi:hypothetical protein